MRSFDDQEEILLVSANYLSLNFWLRTTVIFGRFLSQNTIQLAHFFAENDHCASKKYHWRFNQEWRSICADTVNKCCLGHEGKTKSQSLH